MSFLFFCLNKSTAQPFRKSDLFEIMFIIFYTKLFSFHFKTPLSKLLCNPNKF